MQFKLLIVLIAVFISATGLRAEEKNGVMLNVTRKTLKRGDSRSSSSSQRGEKTQALKIVIKNTSMKEKPAGELQWTIVFRPNVGGERVRHFGSEPLKSLKPSEVLEMVVGAGSHSAGLEFQVIVSHENQETIRVESARSFGSLAELASISIDQNEKAAAGVSE